MIKNLNRYDKIAVVEFNLEDYDGELSVDASCKLALVVFRYKNSVVGKLFLNVNNGVIEIPDIEEITAIFFKALWEQFSKKEIVDYTPFVSVIVCTHNRTGELINCLQSLKNLRYANKEIIIVDNAPVNEETKKLVSSYKNFIYINESRKGLDIARNRGIKEARGEIIAFTDDDAIADNHWLHAIVKHFKNPLVAVVTGITMPLELETKAQIIFEQTNGFNRGFIQKEYNLVNLKPIGSGKVGAGVNMAIRKEYTNEIGLFDEALDGGTYSFSGGDQEFFYRALSRGYLIIYDPGALVWHKHRREMKALKTTIFGYGVGVFAWWSKVVLKDKEFASAFFMVKWFVKNYIFNLFKSILKYHSLYHFQLSMLEIWGTFNGSIAYFRSSNSLKSSLHTAKNKTHGR